MRALLIFLTIAFLTGGCYPSSESSATFATDPIAKPLPSLTKPALPATETWLAEPRPTNSPNMEPTLELSPSPTSNIALQKSLAGLIYEMGGGNGVYLIGADGQLQLLTKQYRAVISPDLSQALHSVKYDGEIWLSDLATGQSKNLTNTPDRYELNFQWWPANPNLIVFTSQPIQELGPWSGYLSTLRTDGTDYQVLDDQGSSFPPAPSPDGKTIAFDRNAQPWLWHITQGAEPILIDQSGLDFRSAVNPAWSPDGKQLAWKVYAENSSWSGVAIIDFNTGAWRLLHPYTPIAGGEPFAEVIWSPDGKWLATVNQGEAEASKSSLSLWVLSSDGNEEHFISNGTFPFWSPDSHWLIYTNHPLQSSSFEENKLMLVEIGQWQPIELDLPGGSIARNWVLLEP